MDNGQRVKTISQLRILSDGIEELVELLPDKYLNLYRINLEERTKNDRFIPKDKLFESYIGAFKDTFKQMTIDLD